MTYIGCRPITYYQIKGSSYDGCNGWNTWICEDFTTIDKNKAYIECKKMNSQQFNHYRVIEKIVVK